MTETQEDQRQQESENDYWRKRLRDLEKGNKDEDSSDN